MRLTLRVRRRSADTQAADSGDDSARYSRPSRYRRVVPFAISAGLHLSLVAYVVAGSRYAPLLHRGPSGRETQLFLVPTTGPGLTGSDTLGSVNAMTVRRRAVRIYISLRPDASTRETADELPKLAIAAPLRLTRKKPDASTLRVMSTLAAVPPPSRLAVIPAVQQPDIPQPTFLGQPEGLASYVRDALNGGHTFGMHETAPPIRVPPRRATLPLATSSGTSRDTNGVTYSSTTDAPVITDTLADTRFSSLSPFERKAATGPPPLLAGKTGTGARGYETGIVVESEGAKKTALPQSHSHTADPPKREDTNATRFLVPNLPVANPLYSGPFWRMDHPANGRFDVVVVQPALEDVVPQIAGLLQGQPVYTVYLEVGDTKEWIMHYAAADAGVVQRGAVVQLPDPRPLTAPYPRVTYRPAEPLSGSALYIYVHGMLDEAGSLHDLKVLGSDADSNLSLLRALTRWLFRPGLRGDSTARVEVLLAIPVSKT